MGRYWVVGGEYRDTGFAEPAGGAEQRIGPFAGYDAARAEWQARAWASVDNALARWRIEEEGPRPRWWVVGGVYRDTAFREPADPGGERRHGPFDSEPEARAEWQRLAWASVDDALARYRIEKRADQAAAAAPPAAAEAWPEGVTVAALRIARPTDRLEEVVAFYRDGLGLPVLLSFRDHDGYDGVMLGLPGRACHLEFTRHRDGSAGPAPSPDDLLVLYIPDPADLARLQARLERHGHRPVVPENLWWRDKAVTFADPDGWRVVLCNGPGL
jgi:catechol 2,3-dioxygenase-like lactoylglutathione lyase family enzyme